MKEGGKKASDIFESTNPPPIPQPPCNVVLQLTTYAQTSNASYLPCFSHQNRESAFSQKSRSHADMTSAARRYEAIHQVTRGPYIYACTPPDHASCSRPAERSGLVIAHFIYYRFLLDLAIVFYRNFVRIIWVISSSEG